MPTVRFGCLTRCRPPERGGEPGPPVGVPGAGPAPGPPRPPAHNVRTPTTGSATAVVAVDRRAVRSRQETVVTPQRRLGFCCGLAREKISELNTDSVPGTFGDLVEAGGSDFLKIWLWVDGPDRIMAWAASKDPCIEWENRYSHHCQTCLALSRTSASVWSASLQVRGVPCGHDLRFGAWPRRWRAARAGGPYSSLASSSGTGSPESPSWPGSGRLITSAYRRSRSRLTMSR